MRLRRIPIKVKPKEGDTKQEKRFAWWPKKVGDRLIWLESYTVVSKFTIRERVHAFQGYGFLKVIGGGWDEIEEGLIEKEGIKPLKEGLTKSQTKKITSSLMGPAPKPIKP